MGIRYFTWHDVLFLLQAAQWTVILSLLAFVGGGFVGGAIALCRISRSWLIRGLSGVYVQVLQGTPLLIQLFIWYFGLSLFGAFLPPIAAAFLALTLYSSAFFAEIWRGSIQAIPRPQWEGSAALGLSRFEQLRYVIVPQALQLATPATVGFMVQIVKNTSLTALIGFVELARAGQLVNNVTFEPLPVFGCIAIFYFLICFPLSALSRRLERRLHVGRTFVGST
jgi:polar amino acid transport system permease protein